MLTDHGSTTIPVGIANDLDLSGFKSTEFTIRSLDISLLQTRNFSVSRKIGKRTVSFWMQQNLEMTAIT